MVSWILFAILLYILAAVLLVVEVFVPSFGIIGTCAIVSLVGGVWIFFALGPVFGWVGVAAAVVLVPVVLILAYRILPHTGFGKQAILAMPDRAVGEGVPDAPQIRKLLGKEGVVITPLRPVGTCQFEELRIECVSESGFVTNGTKVRVINVDGTQVTVRTI